MLSLLITTYNRYEHTKRTVDSLLIHTPIDSEYIIVDNNSTEGELTAYLSDLSNGGFKVIRKETNTGWADAVNEGLKYCSSDDYILISNNDVEYKEGWFEKAKQAYEKYPEIGILGVWKHTAHHTIENKGDLEIRDNTPAVGWLLRRKNLEKIGPFIVNGPCETKGGNGEDTTMCILTQQQGLWVANLPEDIATHIDGY